MSSAGPGRGPKGSVHMEALLQDVRYGLRMLVKKPTFTIVAVLTLALGVGANTALFRIVNAVLLRSLPFRDPDRLVRIYFNNPGVGLRNVRFSVPEFDDLRTQTDVFEDVSVTVFGPTNLTGAKQPEHLEMMEVSPNYFSMLGATPELGRLFGHQDFALGFAPVVVISDALWRRSYGADPGVLGRSLRLDNDLYTIVGVLSPGFRNPGPTIPAVEVWITCGYSADPFPPPARSLRILPGAIGGLTTAVITLKAVLRFVPANLPRLSEVNIDWRVLGFALLISLATGLLFGLAPATHSSKAGLAGTMREGSRGSGYSAKAGRMRDALMVSQLAFAVVLMIGAGLLLETLRDLLRQNPGFNPSQVVTAK